ncbi:MAG TPA: hypothetical protein VFK79_11630 [Xanthobacteraceae bacterium]|nr:hypothetical protein [Xanthobacteraceae bacterium]
MKTFITTVAIVAALVLPAFGEGSEDTKGEALGNLKMSTISPSQDGPTDRIEIGVSSMALGSMAQGRILRRSETSGSGSASTARASSLESEKRTSGADIGGGFSPGSSGADGGNRK